MSGLYVDLPEDDVSRTLQHELESQLEELQALHDSNKDALQEALSPKLLEKLRELSLDKAFFPFPSDDSSSENAESLNEPPELSQNASEQWEAKKMTFKFITDVFALTHKDHQMKAVRSFVDQVKGTANRIKLAGGASLSPDSNSTLKRCVTAVKTMKEVVDCKFSSFQGFVERQIRYRTGEGPSTSEGFPPFNMDSAQETPDVINPSDASQNYPSMTDGNLAEADYALPGVSNPNVESVIKPNVAHRTSPSSSGIKRGARRAPSPSHYSPSSPKRRPLTRQPHVPEED